MVGNPLSKNFITQKSIISFYTVYFLINFAILFLFTNIMYNTATLDNGLRIIHRHSSSPIIYCGYQIAAGTRNEPEGYEGLAHFCEHMSFKGTERRTAMQIINRLESVGGELNAFTNKEATVYYAALQKEHLPKAVDLLSDIVFHSTYPQAEINKEVEVICDEIESYNDSPAELIYDEFENIIFHNHPLGHNILGTSGKVRSFTTDDALRFTNQYYVPQNAIFFCYGDIDFKTLFRLIKKSNTNNQRTGAPKEQPVIATTATNNDVIIRAMGTHQAHVMIGTRAYDVHDKRRMALYLLNNILGGPGMNARLNLSLRERHALVYTVESTMVSYGDTGLWSIYFGCDQKDVKRCRKLVRKELDKLMNKPLTDKQLSAAKQQIKGQIALACDNRESFAIDFGKSFLHYGWEKDINSLYRNIDNLTAEQLLDAARDIFDNEKLTTLIYQ